MHSSVGPFQLSKWLLAVWPWLSNQIRINKVLRFVGFSLTSKPFKCSGCLAMTEYVCTFKDVFVKASLFDDILCTLLDADIESHPPSIIFDHIFETLGFIQKHPGSIAASTLPPLQHWAVPMWREHTWATCYLKVNWDGPMRIRSNLTHPTSLIAAPDHVFSPGASKMGAVGPVRFHWRACRLVNLEWQNMQKWQKGVGDTAELQR